MAEQRNKQEINSIEVPGRKLNKEPIKNPNPNKTKLEIVPEITVKAIGDSSRNADDANKGKLNLNKTSSGIAENSSSIVENLADADNIDNQSSSTKLKLVLSEILAFDEEKIPRSNDEDTVHNYKAQDKDFKGWKRFLGMGLAVLASFFLSLGIALVKLLNHYTASSMILWRFSGGILLPSCVVITFLHVFSKPTICGICAPIKPPCQIGKIKTGLFLCIRGIAGVCSILFQYYALDYLSVSDATVIAFSTPVFVTFIACIWLGEKCGFVDAIAVFVVLSGVTVITRPPFLGLSQKADTKLLIGAGWAFGSMIGSTFVFISLRVLNGVHFTLITFCMGLYGTVFCTILCAIEGVFELPSTNSDWVYATITLICTYGGQVSGTLAFHFEQAGPIALCRTFDVIFSFIWQALLLHETPDAFSLLGTMIVMSGVLLIGFRKYISSLPDDHKCKKKLWCILK